MEITPTYLVVTGHDVTIKPPTDRPTAAHRTAWQTRLPQRRARGFGVLVLHTVYRLGNVSTQKGEQKQPFSQENNVKALRNGHFQVFQRIL